MACFHFLLIKADLIATRLHFFFFLITVDVWALSWLIPRGIPRGPTLGPGRKQGISAATKIRTPLPFVRVVASLPLCQCLEGGSKAPLWVHRFIEVGQPSYVRARHGRFWYDVEFDPPYAMKFVTIAILRSGFNFNFNFKK